MEILRDYEKTVLRLLTSNVLSSGQLEIVIRDSEVSYEYSGCGYFLTLSHPDLPEKRVVCHHPLVIGEADGITCGFVVFIEKREITIECHDWGEIEVPANFRDKDVNVRPVKIIEGKFVPI